MSLEKLLTKLGVDKDTVKKAQEDGFDADSFIEDWDKSQRTTYFELYKNSTEYKDELKKAKESSETLVGKSVDNAFKKYLDKDQLSELTTAKERLEAIVEKLGKQDNKDVEDLQTEVQKLKQNLEDKDKEIEEEKKKIILEAEKEKVSLKLRKLMEEYKDDQLVGDKGGVYELAEFKLNQKYDFKLNEDNEIVPYLKGTDKKAEKGNKFATAQEILNDTLEDSKLLRHSTGGGEKGGGDAGAGDDNKGDVTVSKRTGEKFEKRPGTAKLDERLAKVTNA